MAINKRVEVIVHGRVQGVCFRAYMQKEASRLGVCGWVKNCRDGSVKGVLEGDSQAVASLVKWCENGPSYARVSSVETQKQPYTGEFTHFSIHY